MSSRREQVIDALTNKNGDVIALKPAKGREEHTGCSDRARRRHFRQRGQGRPLPGETSRKGRAFQVEGTASAQQWLRVRPTCGG